MNSTCKILFVSVLILQDGTMNRKEYFLKELELHHKSIDKIHPYGRSCKYVITDHYTAQIFKFHNYDRSFELYISELGGHSFYDSRKSMIDGCPLPRMLLFGEFLQNLRYSLNIVLIDTDTLVIKNLETMFIKYSDFDIGFTLSFRARNKQKDTYLNVGAIYIHGGNNIQGAANLLQRISNLCVDDKKIIDGAVILDQFSTFFALEKYCMSRKCDIFQKSKGDCILVKVPALETEATRVLLLGDEFNTVATKLYRGSHVVHFTGNRKSLMKNRAKYFLENGEKKFVKRFAHPRSFQERENPNANWCKL